MTSHPTNPKRTSKSRQAEYARSLADLQSNTNPIRNSTTRGYYDGAELRAFDGRPGAMDAYALPSLGLAE